MAPTMCGGPTRRSPLLMDTLERPTEVLDQSRKRQLECGATTDQHIVTSRLEPARVRKPHDFAQSAPHPIALDRVADLLRHRKADTWRSCFGAPAGLQHKGRRRNPRTRRGSQKVRPL